MSLSPFDLLRAAVASHQAGQFAQAERQYRALLRIEPANADALNNLALICLERGHGDEAARLARRAVKTAPQSPEAHCTLGNALQTLNRNDEAILSYRMAIRLRPKMVAAYRNLGLAMLAAGRPSDAMASFEAALEIQPSLVAAHRGMAEASLALSLPKRAIKNYEAALRLEPGSPAVRSNLLMCLNYVDPISPEEVYAAHTLWERFHGLDRTELAPKPNNTPRADRRLRVGYVSPDFRRHSVYFFVRPMLGAHDREKVETFCYADVRKPDDFTRDLKAHSDHWIPVDGIDDVALANRIRIDGIDILVDLTGHTAKNRLKMFASKPAPIQVSWLGYPNTTGLGAIGYRITDWIADPHESEDRFYTEKLIRLPRCFVCYRPPQDLPDVSPSPYEKLGRISFGSFNDLNKVTDSVIHLWARLLISVADSTLLLKARQLSDPVVQGRVLAQFESAGIERDRISLLGHVPSQRDHLAAYANVDIALDTFPYNGTTTTCEALTMGVPVVTVSGGRHASRVGASLLNAANCRDLVAENAAAYAEIAAGLARDSERLRKERLRLRDRFLASQICDAGDFAAAMERAYRDMWRIWCDQQAGPASADLGA